MTFSGIITSFSTTITMLSKSLNNGKNFFSYSPSAAQIRAIKASAYVIFDLKTDGALSVEISNGQKFAWNVLGMKNDVRATLIHTCLHNHTVIGRDLTIAYAWSDTMSPTWTPACTLDVAAMARAFELDEDPIAAESDALAAVYAISGVHSFDESLQAIGTIDESFGGRYFGGTELVPFGLRKIIVNAMTDMMLNDSMQLDFKAYITQTDSGYYLLHSMDKEVHIMFAEAYLPIMEEEIDLALEQAVEKISAFASR